MKHRVPLPARKLDSPWAVSQDVQMGRFGLLEYMCEEDFQMPPYPWQYVQNEILLPVAWSSCGRNGCHVNLFKILRPPTLPGSISATIYRENTAVQWFHIRESGVIEITAIGTPEIFVQFLNFINLTGYLELRWNGDPGHNHVVISYEYEYSSSVEYNGEQKSC